MNLEPFQAGEWVVDQLRPAKPLLVLEVKPWPNSPTGWVARTRERLPGMDRIDWIETGRLSRTSPPSGPPPGGDHLPGAA